MMVWLVNYILSLQLIYVKKPYPSFSFSFPISIFLDINFSAKTNFDINNSNHIMPIIDFIGDLISTN